MKGMNGTEPLSLFVAIAIFAIVFVALLDPERFGRTVAAIQSGYERSLAEKRETP
jgi:hypothetical protein